MDVLQSSRDRLGGFNVVNRLHQCGCCWVATPPVSRCCLADAQGNIVLALLPSIPAATIVFLSQSTTACYNKGLGLRHVSQHLEDKKNLRVKSRITDLQQLQLLFFSNLTLVPSLKASRGRCTKNNDNNYTTTTNNNNNNNNIKAACTPQLDECCAG